MRKPRHIRLDMQKALALQATFTPLTVYNARKVTTDENLTNTARQLKLKIASATLDLASGMSDEVQVEIDEDEAWLLDAAIEVTMGAWAKDLILDVYRVLWECEYGVNLTEEEEGGGDAVHPEGGAT